MTEEEEKAVEFVRKRTKELKKYAKRENELCYDDIVLNLVSRLLKENEKYKRLAEMNLRNAEEFKNNMCKHRCLLKSENEELKAENEYNKLLLDTNKNFTIDKKNGNYKWNVIEIQKVKDKIEKYKNMCISNVKGYENYFKDNYNELVFRRMEQLETELLESEE